MQTRLFRHVLTFRRYITLIFLWSFLPIQAAPVASGRALSSSPEQWYIITIADKPVGYVHELASSISAPEGELIVSTSDVKMVLNRLGSKVELQFLTVYEETKDGLLRKVNYEMRASLMTTKTEAVIRGKTIELRSAVGGKSYSRTLNFSGELLGPEGIRLISQKRLQKAGDIAEFQTFVPELEAVSKGSRKVLAAEKLLLGGKEILVLKTEEMIDATAVKSTAWLGGDNEAVKQEMPTPFGLAQIILADKSRALSAVSGNELPAEMYERSIIRANVRLPKARDLEYLKIKLIHKNPDLGWPEIKGPYQTVLSKSRDDLILEIKRPRRPKPAPLPVPGNEKNREFLQPNAYIQSDALEVKRTVQDVLAGEKDVFKAALKLERWVSENMKFDLGIALAPSSEIFENRRGTCLGYATLLATLTRAAGIPSRVVLGYVYALGMFGGHAWTEILVGNDWIPLDAAITAREVADAGRLYFVATSLYEGVGSLSGGASQRLFGQIDIKILEFAGADGKRIVVPEGAASYRIRSNFYENPWLGLTVQKPADFKFTKLDAVWPDSALVALEGPRGARAELQQYYLPPWKKDRRAAKEIFGRLGISENLERKTIQGLPGFMAKNSKRAVLVLLDDPEAWILIAEGKDASTLLEQIAASLKFKSIGR
jgi:hypothetical protein